jgi:hypothetical protein
MRKILPIIILTIACGLLLVAARNAGAQTVQPAPSFTAGLQEMADAVSSSTNWTVITGVGRATKGNRDIAFGAIAYNFNQNVGLVAGVDTLWAPNQDIERQQNVVKGGVTLSAPIHPFAFIGSSFATNIVGTPFAAALVASPSGGSSDSIATIATVGCNFDLVSFKNFELVVGGQYETRSGSGFWNGNYIIVHLGISRRF